jgi:hypothetical protein
MDLLNPSLTIQNTAGPNWLVRFTHRDANGEDFDITMLVPKGNLSVPQVHVAAMERAIDRLQRLIQSTRDQAGVPATKP